MYDRILVTGGAGFVGSSLAMALQAAHPASSVTALDNLRRRGSELNLDRLRHTGVRFAHGDVRCREDLDALPETPELILECSAESSVLAGYGGSPEYLIDSNLTGCFHCLEYARRVKADFIFFSTSRVYPYALLNELAYIEEETRFSLRREQTLRGASEWGVSEDFPMEGPRSLYGMTKLAGELMLQEYADAYGIRGIVNRCGLLTGPWQLGKTDQGVIALWMLAHYFGKPLRYIGFEGSGKQVRDFLHIEDLVDLLEEQISHFDRYAGKCFNVGGGKTCSLSLRETTELCRTISGRSISISSSTDDRPVDVRIYISDHRRISSLCGWKPKRAAQQTLTDIFNWIHKEERRLKPILAMLG